MTAAWLIESLMQRGLRPFSYPSGAVYLNTQDEAVAQEMRALGASVAGYQPDARMSPGVQAFEVRLDVIPGVRGDLRAALAEWGRGD